MTMVHDRLFNRRNLRVVVRDAPPGSRRPVLVWLDIDVPCPNASLTAAIRRGEQELSCVLTQLETALQQWGQRPGRIAVLQRHRADKASWHVYLDLQDYEFATVGAVRAFVRYVFRDVKAVDKEPYGKTVHFTIEGAGKDDRPECFEFFNLCVAELR
eukprot:gene6826-6064_t